MKTSEKPVSGCEMISNLQPLSAIQKQEIHNMVALLRIGTKMNDQDWKQLRAEAQAQKVRMNSARLTRD